ncbi:MAG: hypothetical protein MJZ13_08615 [Bacteroidales bacterium]|nr:hypothetical protein [Bacteroidales bacterium]
MKKLFIAMAALVCSMSVSAQTIKVMKGDAVVATYTAAQADKVVFVESTPPAVAMSKLNIKVTSSDIATLKAIKVVTDRDIDDDGNEKIVSIAKALRTPAADGTVYSIEIPSQEYAYYQIYLSDDGTTFKEAMATKNPTGVGEISTDIDIDYEKNAVQLWADGPYFATMNVGETTETGHTQRYYWGATEAEGAANGTANNPNDYDLAHDTAYKIWGPAWRMPTWSEFLSLKSNSTQTVDQISQGFFIESNTSGYGSIFLPAVDWYDDPVSSTQSAHGYYWSADKYDSSSVYYFYISFSSDKSDYGIKAYMITGSPTKEEYPVRAVLR